MAPPRCAGLFAITPERPPLDAAQRRDDSASETGAKLQHRASCPARARSARACRRRAIGFRESRREAARWSAHSHRDGGPGKTTDSFAPRRPPRSSSSTRMSITPLAACTSLGPTSSGLNRPRPPPSIIAGPPMPILEPRVAMITSQQPSRAALPAKQRPATMPITGAGPLNPAKRAKVVICRPATIASVGVARPPAAAFGEQHQRQPVALGDLEHAVRLLMAAQALRARQHRRVIGEHRGARLFRAEQSAVDAADAGDDPVGGRVRDQVVELAARALGGDGQRAIFDETAGVAEIGDVFARRAQAERVTLVDRLRAGLVSGRGKTVDDSLRDRRARDGRRRGFEQRLRASTSAPASSRYSSASPGPHGRRPAPARGRTRPARSASTRCSIFIASSMATGAPDATSAPSSTHISTTRPAIGAAIATAPIGMSVCEAAGRGAADFLAVRGFEDFRGAAPRPRVRRGFPRRSRYAASAPRIRVAPPARAATAPLVAHPRCGIRPERAAGAAHGVREGMAAPSERSAWPAARHIAAKSGSPAVRCVSTRTPGPEGMSKRVSASDPGARERRLPACRR